jgi:hypothetical protein
LYPIIKPYLGLSDLFSVDLSAALSLQHFLSPFLQHFLSLSSPQQLVILVFVTAAKAEALTAVNMPVTAKIRIAFFMGMGFWLLMFLYNKCTKINDPLKTGLLRYVKAQQAL